MIIKRLFLCITNCRRTTSKSEIDLIKRISITLENRNIRSKEQSSYKLHRKNRSRERCYPYYLSQIIGGLVIISILMLMLALYINANLRYLRKAGYLKNLEKLNFSFLNQGAFVPVLVLGLHIIILYNLQLPQYLQHYYILLC